MTRSLYSVIIVCILLTLSVSAYANSGIVLSFQGLGDQQVVGNFYNGGGLPSTPNYGIVFSSNFLGLRSTANGGAGFFNSTPVGTPAIFVTGPSNGAAVTGVMNVMNGFQSGLNFYYAFNLPGGFKGLQNVTVTIWSGANGSGNVLATISLSANGCQNSSPSFCQWSSAGTSFSGNAHSVTFAGPSNFFGLSDVTLGSSGTAIPEPSTLFLLGTGLVGISLGRVRRFLGL